MLLSQKDSQRLLKKYGISLPETKIFKSLSQLDKSNISYPLVLKVDSPYAVHKTEMGLVQLNIRNFAELERKIFSFERKLLDKHISDYSFVLQEMVKGTELIIGMKSDKTFGKVIVFGLGGIFVELMKDVSMRILPITKKDSMEMISEIKSAKVLDGYRGLPKADKNSIEVLLLKTSKMCMAEKKIIEMDFNPVFADEGGCVVADARIIIGGKDA